MRDPATGRFLGRKDIGPFDPRVRLSGKPRVRVPAQTQAMNEGGSIRDGIMRNYAMMADGKSVSRHLGIKPEQGKSTFPKYEMYFPTSPEEISDIRDRLDEDKSYGRQIRKYFNPYYLSDVLSKMGKDD